MTQWLQVGQVGILAAMVLWVAVESYVTTRSLKFEIRRAHLRITAMNNGPTRRDTVPVDYVRGFESKDDWGDDFRRTKLKR